MKRLRGILIILLVIAASLILAKNVIAKMALAGGVKAITGLNAEIKSLDVGLFNTAIGINGLSVLNPPGFADKVMIEVPEIYVDYKMSSFLKGKVHFEEVRLNLQEFNVIKSPEGKLNLHAVKAIESGKEQAPQKPQTVSPPQFQIDVLELKVGKVVYKDYTQSPTLVKEFTININERYEHISHPATFAKLVISRALIKTSVDRLAHFDVKGLQESVTEALKQSAAGLTSTLTGNSEVVEKMGKDAVGGAKDAFEGATEKLKEFLGK